LSTRAAAEALGVSRSTLLRWFREGRIRGVGRDRNGWRQISRSDIERMRKELGEPRSALAGQSNPKLRSYLRSVPTFRSLPDQVLDQLAAEARFHGFLKGQHVFVPGDPSRGLYIVVKGRVRVHRISLQGREQTLRVAVPFQTLGESLLFRPGQRHSHHALCLESSTILALPVGRLLALTDAFPVLAQAFLREFSQRIQDLEERLEVTALLSLEQRVARLLLEADSMGIATSPREMAAYLGAARESVSRVLLRFAKDGLLVKQGRSFVIVDPAKFPI